MNRPFVLAAALLPLAACGAAPELGAPKTATSGLRSVLGTDFATDRFARRSEAVGEHVRAVGSSELRRPAHARWREIEPRPADQLLDMGTSMRRIAAAEVAPPAPQAGWLADEVAPDSIARDLAENLASVPVYLRTDRQPLGEIDDLRHRTDPFDAKPEATLLERIVRRLRL